MVACSRCALSNASTHCLSSVSDAHSRSRMAVRSTGSAAWTAALKTASIRFASTAMAIFLGKELTLECVVLDRGCRKKAKTSEAIEHIEVPARAQVHFCPTAG